MQSTRKRLERPFRVFHLPLTTRRRIIRDGVRFKTDVLPIHNPVVKKEKIATQSTNATMSTAILQNDTDNHQTRFRRSPRLAKIYPRPQSPPAHVHHKIPIDDKKQSNKPLIVEAQQPVLKHRKHSANIRRSQNAPQGRARKKRKVVPDTRNDSEYSASQDQHPNASSSDSGQNAELYCRDARQMINKDTVVRVIQDPLKSSNSLIGFLKDDAPLVVRHKILVDFLSGHDRARLVGVCKDMLNLLQGTPYDEFPLNDLASALEIREYCLWKFGRTRLVLLDVDSIMRWLPLKHAEFMSTVKDIIVDSGFTRIESFAGFEKFTNARRLFLRIRDIPPDFETLKAMSNLRSVEVELVGAPAGVTNTSTLLTSARSSYNSLSPIVSRRLSTSSASSTTSASEPLPFSTAPFKVLAEMVKMGSLQELSWRPYISDIACAQLGPDSTKFWVKQIFEDIDWTGLVTLHLHLSIRCDFDAIDSNLLLPILPFSLERLIIHDVRRVGSKFTPRHREMINDFVQSRAKMTEVIEL